MDDTLNATQAAQLVGVSEKTMRSWLKKKDEQERPMILGAWKDDGAGGPAQWRIPRASLDGLAPLSHRLKDRATFDSARLLDLERQLQELRAQVSGQNRTSPRPPVPDSQPRHTQTPAVAGEADVGGVHTKPGRNGASGRFEPRDPDQAITRRLNRTAILPHNLRSWRQMADQHGIPETTVKHAIARGRLRIIRGRWRPVGGVGAPITAAFDVEGQRQFYREYGSRKDFIKCTDCPHHPTADVQADILPTASDAKTDVLSGGQTQAANLVASGTTAHR